jgi:hypothetical protein
MDSNGHFLFSVLVLFVQFPPLNPVKNGCFRAYEPIIRNGSERLYVQLWLKLVEMLFYVLIIEYI